MINLERVAAGYVLDNIRQAITHRRTRLLQRIASYELETGRRLTLHDFLDYHKIELDDIYKRSCWRRLQVEAGMHPSFEEPDEERLSKGLRRVTHINGVTQLMTLLSVLPDPLDFTFEEPRDELHRRFLLMLHFVLWGPQWCPSTIAQSFERLLRNPTLYGELRELLELRVRQYGQRSYPQRNAVTDLRRYFSGSIGLGVRSWLHRFLLQDHITQLTD